MARTSARPPAGAGKVGPPRIKGRSLRVGGRSVPLYSGAMHYWRLSDDAWKPALEELRNMGLPIVETYAPWGVHEIAKGEFDFGERDPRKNLGRFIDLAGEIGLYVFIRPGPHINAEMTNFGVPERVIYDKACQARSPRQNPVILPFPPQMFPVPSYASTAYHAEVGGWFDAVGRIIAPRIYPKGPIVMAQVDNEAAYYFRNGPYDQDFHPDAVSMYRKFLETKYGGSLEAIASAHRARYPSWDELQPPHKFSAARAEDLVVHLDFAEFQEELITLALERMKKRMGRAGIRGLPITHNIPLGDGGVPMSIPAIDKVVDLVGLDYYHAAREFRTIKRRSLYMTGTVELPYAPELGVGAPPWFTPLSHQDSMFCAMTACAYGLRGFNLYMAVDRDRWYGAPIDAQGMPRVEAGAWKHLVGKLKDVNFHELERKVEVALVVPREYGRLSRATHLLGGLVSPSTMEAIGSTPVEACREDTFGFKGPVQVLWWRMLAKMSDALTAAGIPYVYVDGETPIERLDQIRLLVTPTYEFVADDRWKQLAALARDGVTIVYGPAMPSLDEQMRNHPFEVPRNGRRVLVDAPEDAEALVRELAQELDLAAPFRATPAPVETAVHEDDEGPQVLFVLHPGTEDIDAHIALPGSMVLVDALSGERFELAQEAVIRMPAKTVRMFLLQQTSDSSAHGSRAKRGTA